MILKRLLITLAVASACFAGTVRVPSLPVTIPASSATGSSFTFSGTLTDNDTIDLVLGGAGCLQTGGTAYCTNGAGVLTVPGGGFTAGQTATGSMSVGGYTKTYDYGAVIMVISGVGAVQIFPANAANGLGSGAPTTSLWLSTTSLSALGFPHFSATNPTISFIIADDNRADNGGSITLTQPASVPGAPVVGTWWLLLLGLTAAAATLWIKNRSFAPAPKQR